MVQWSGITAIFAMQATTQKTTDSEAIERMFRAGAHFGFSKSRRHPTASPFIFGVKQRVEIFDLEKTALSLETAKEFVRSLAREGRTILLIGGKPESRAAIKSAGERIGMPYVASRFIGGTLTNASEIKKRIGRLEELRAAKESGELSKYTKKERLMIDREIARLEASFGGIIPLKDGMPGAIFIVDTRREHIAVKEAKALKIPTIGLSNSDCNFADVTFPIPGNDAAIESVTLFVNEIADAYQEGRTQKA